MPEERAFTRRQPGVNPIALELDRLAEQKALQTLGRSRGAPGVLPRSADLTATTAPMASDAAEAARIEALRQASPDAPQWEQLSPARKELANAWDLAPGELDAAMQRAVTPFNYEPGDPYWGGLEEDEAYKLWTERLSDVAKLYPDMSPREREMFTQGMKTLR